MARNVQSSIRTEWNVPRRARSFCLIYRISLTVNNVCRTGIFSFLFFLCVGMMSAEMLRTLVPAMANSQYLLMQINRYVWYVCLNKCAHLNIQWMWFTKYFKQILLSLARGTQDEPRSLRSDLIWHVWRKSECEYLCYLPFDYVEIKIEWKRRVYFFIVFWLSMFCIAFLASEFLCRVLAQRKTLLCFTFSRSYVSRILEAWK